MRSDDMKTRKLNGTPVTVTELGFGAAVIGNLYRAISDQEAVDAVDAAWAAGIRYFDTAPHYGLGLSERRLGTALAGRPREEIVVSSKVGRLLVPNESPTGQDSEGFAVPDDWHRVRDYSRDGVLRSIEASLARTGLDRLDIVYVHDPDDWWQQAADEAMPALAELRDQGMIGAIGAGMNESAMLKRFLTETAADVVMLAGRYTLLEQGALDDVLPAAEEQGKSVVAVGVFNSGILSKNRPERGATYNYEAAPQELLERAGTIASVCEEFGTTLPAAAMAFPLGHPAVVNVTVGMRTAAQVERNLAIYESGVPVELWQELRTRGLIRPDAPTPKATATIPAATADPTAPVLSMGD
jgi:D-threo-aldose 1-dehydrogenase